MATISSLYFTFLIPLILLFNPISSSSSFSPSDNYLVNCGSTTTLSADHRPFSGDSDHLVTHTTTSLSNPTQPPHSSPILQTARVFTRPGFYRFHITHPGGAHLIRLHFKPLHVSNLDFTRAKFHVLANKLVLFNTSNPIFDDVIIKDYIIPLHSAQLTIHFIPFDKSSFAFINAIEVISAPDDLVADVALHVVNGKNEQIHGLLSHGFETVHRINVGGFKVTPFNDSLWRTWVPDDEFIGSFNNESSKVHFSGRISYQEGGASREVGPDNVYNSARVIKSVDDSVPDVNMTWRFPVMGGFKYLVRLHFCDIASIARGLLVFNVYVNSYLAYENLDLTAVTNGELASPFYADFVVDGDTSGTVSVSVGPSNMSLPRAVDGILNGVEIMKISNSVGSFYGEVCADSVLRRWKRGYVDVVCLVVGAVCLLLMAFVIMYRRRFGVGDYSRTWWRLPTEIPEINLKSSNKF